MAQGESQYNQNPFLHNFSLSSWDKDFHLLTFEQDDDLLDDNGFAKLKPPNNWKGKRGLYCAGLAGSGLAGARTDAEKIADDITTLL